MWLKNRFTYRYFKKCEKPMPAVVKAKRRFWLSRHNTYTIHYVYIKD